jgi:hypothetical protein
VFEVRSARGLEVVEALRGLPEVRAAGLFGRAVHVTLADAAGIGAVEARLAERGVHVDSLKRIEPTLEHVFIASVQESGGVVDG